MENRQNWPEVKRVITPKDHTVWEAIPSNLELKKIGVKFVMEPIGFIWMKYKKMYHFDNAIGRINFRKEILAGEFD